MKDELAKLEKSLHAEKVRATRHLARIRSLRKQRDRIDAALNRLLQKIQGAAPRQTHHKISTAARRRMSIAAKKRWQQAKKALKMKVAA